MKGRADLLPAARLVNTDSVGATIIIRDGNSFAQKAMKMLNTDSFVIAASGDMNGNVQNRTDGLEETLFPLFMITLKYENVPLFVSDNSPHHDALANAPCLARRPL
jgi:hypothetical protein